MLLSDVNNLMQSINNDFPTLSKVYSIGKSFEGRDINVIELTRGSNGEQQSLVQLKDDEDDVFTGSMMTEKKKKPTSNKPAILMTGATHARELISTNFNVF